MKYWTEKNFKYKGYKFFRTNQDGKVYYIEADKERNQLFTLKEVKNFINKIAK